MWSQQYDPLGNAVVSTAIAAVPVLVLLGSLAILKVRAHFAALYGLLAAFLIATIIYGMPLGMAVGAGAFGMCFGALAICWIITNVIFLYHLTTERGHFANLQNSISRITGDRRLQLLLIAFCFGAFFEGAAGGGTPVAVTGALLIGLGFSPLKASALSLIANTAPVAYGGLGTPIFALQAVTGLDLMQLSGMVGRQLPVFSVIVPFWLVLAFCGVRRTLEVWPAVLVAGATFAVSQFIVSNFHGPTLVDVVSAIASTLALSFFLRVWQPSRLWLADPIASPARSVGAAAAPLQRGDLVRCWMPWIILMVTVFVWGLPPVKRALDSISLIPIEVPGLHNLIQRVPPVVAQPTAEPAIWRVNWLSVPGTGVFVSAILGGLFLGYTPREMVAMYWRTLKLVRFSLLTIVAMLGLGFITRYSGTDATLGLAFAHAGWLYPLFGTLLGWLGTALTGTDAASNVLFGSLQKITATQIGLSPVLMAAANSSGGVMGKMIDAQSIVVATTATRWYGHEGTILRYVFLHSIALAILVGLLVMLQAYVPPFTYLVY
jgi:lactate permease